MIEYTFRQNFDFSSAEAGLAEGSPLPPAFFEIFASSRSKSLSNLPASLAGSRSAGGAESESQHGGGSGGGGSLRRI